MIAVYLAHQLSAPTPEGMDDNRLNAAKWAAWLWKQGFAVECSWIVCTSMLDETPENRELGLNADCEQVRRCDVMVLCGRKVSKGMLREAGAAKVIIDFTHLGLELPPADLEWFNGRPVTLKILEEMDLLNAAIEENNKRAGNSDKTTPSPPPSLEESAARIRDALADPPPLHAGDCAAIQALGAPCSCGAAP